MSRQFDDELMGAHPNTVQGQDGPSCRERAWGGAWTHELIDRTVPRTSSVPLVEIAHEYEGAVNRLGSDDLDQAFCLTTTLPPRQSQVGHNEDNLEISDLDTDFDRTSGLASRNAQIMKRFVDHRFRYEDDIPIVTVGSEKRGTGNHFVLVG
jgi:hypothetical protein